MGLMPETKLREPGSNPSGSFRELDRTVAGVHPGADTAPNDATASPYTANPRLAVRGPCRDPIPQAPAGNYAALMAGVNPGRTQPLTMLLHRRTLPVLLSALGTAPNGAAAPPYTAKPYASLGVGGVQPLVVQLHHRPLPTRTRHSYALSEGELADEDDAEGMGATS